MNTTAPLAAGSRPRDLVKMATQLPVRKGKPNLRAEADASAKLSRVLASDPSAAVLCVLEIARDLCRAGTAGLSVLRTGRADDIKMRWELVRGALASYEGIDTPRANSPCGLCLDAGTTILVSRPTRAFSWLEGTEPLMIETLIVPLQDDAGNVHGTLWIAHHAPDSRCTSDDTRILEQLAQQLMLALRLQEHARHRERAATLLQSLQVAQQRLLSHDVDRERIRRMQAEAAELETGRELLFKDAMIDEVNHRTKNTLLAASSLLTMQANATSSVEVRRALLDSHARLQLLAKVHALLCIEPNNTQTVFMPQLLQAVCDALSQGRSDERAPVCDSRSRAILYRYRRTKRLRSRCSRTRQSQTPISTPLRTSHQEISLCSYTALPSTGWSCESATPALARSWRTANTAWACS